MSNMNCVNIKTEGELAANEVVKNELKLYMLKSTENIGEVVVRSPITRKVTVTNGIFYDGLTESYTHNNENFYVRVKNAGCYVSVLDADSLSLFISGNGYVKVVGGADAIADLIGLQTLVLNDNILGSLSCLYGMDDLVSCDITGTSLYGGLQDVGKKNNLQYFKARNNPVIDVFKPDVVANVMPNIKELFSGAKGFRGDMSLLPNSCYFAWSDFPSRCTWKHERRSGMIVSMNNIYFGDDIDKMFIDQSYCSVDPEAIGDAKKIIVNGNRTSASDSAVDSLKKKGFTVIVNGSVL